MLITELSPYTFKVCINPAELKHFELIVAGADKKSILNVRSLIGYILTYSEQHWYEAIQEPIVPPLNNFKDDNGNGNSST